MTAVAPLLWYADDSKIGAGLNYTYPISVTTYPEYPALPFKLGETVRGINNSTWVFVQASSTVTAGNVVAITPQFTANNLTETLTTAAVNGNLLVGVAQFTNGQPTNIQSTTTQIVANGPTTGNTTGDGFWACIEAAAGLQININSTAQPASVLYISSTVGGSVQSTASAQPLGNLYVNTSFGTGQTNTSQSVTDGFILGRIRVSTTI